MDRLVIAALHDRCEKSSQFEDGVTFWYARDIQGLLAYAKWENFESVIARAMTSCETSGQPVKNHFLDVRKMVAIGSESTREIKDFKLTRYACYLIAIKKAIEGLRRLLLGL